MRHADGTEATGDRSWPESWHHPPVTSTITAAPRTPADPTHPCARCGAPVGLGIGLCERCNPLGLRDVASGQVHGSVFLAVLGAVIILAVLARISIAGVGPFGATVDAVNQSGAGLTVTLTVTNDGSSAGQTTCRVGAAGDRGSGAGAIVLTPRLEAGETRTFTAVVPELGPAVRDLKVACRTP